MKDDIFCDIKKLKDTKEKLIHIADTLRKYPILRNYNFKKLFETFKRINYNSRVPIESELDDFGKLSNSLAFLYNLEQQNL